MRKGIIFCLITLVFISSYCQAQYHKIAPFKDGEVVCFVGNSITHAGEFHHNIFLYYLTRFPEKKIQFYNNGISGDVTAGILKRMDDDILFHKPTTAVIMIGMNDVQRNLYTINTNPVGDTLQRRALALVIYRHNLDSIVRIFLQKKVRVILQKPSIYDQTAVTPRPNNLGSNDALKICAGYMQEIAEQYKLDIVDYWTIMSEINNRLQKADPSATIVGGDRIHPGPLGSQIMAYQFIHSTDLAAYTTNLVIKDTRKESNKQSFKCEVLELTRTPKYVIFKAKEYALPYAVRTSAVQSLNLVPITDSINCQRIQIDNLKTGNYELRINDIFIGNFQSEQFQKGINLSDYRNTPQYVRSSDLRKYLDENYFTVEANWRTVKFFEYRYLSGFSNKSDTAAVRKYMYEKYPAINESVRNSINKYVELQPQKEGLLKQLKLINTKAHNRVMPGVYTYKLTKLD